MTKNTLKKSSITRRWLINSLGIIIVIIILLEIIVSLSVRNFYYGGVKQAIALRANAMLDLVLSYEDDPTTEITGQIRSLVENFSEKDRMELMGLDAYGNVVVTSSGFESDGTSDMPDFKGALNSETGTYEYFFTGQNGENVMAVTYLLPITNRQFSAFRYVVSLSDVDKQIINIILIFTGVCLIMLLFVIISGVYFIRTIVKPVAQIGKISRRIASGDFNVRINKQYDDEIGQLCDVINDMAGELAATENMKNEFISLVSHELRTPLTAIKGWGETILDSGPSDKKTLNKGMKIIIEETERLSAMVEELLDFSRIQAGGFSLALSKVDIIAELTEAVIMFGERAKRENVELLYEEPDLVCTVLGDRDRLRQVFVNIIDNAIKYSDAGGKVTVLAFLKNDSIMIEVDDTGHGISEDDLPKVKTKFFRGKQSRRGSGIGLAVADEIIASHKGSLSIESAVGQGTKVTIEIPTLSEENTEIVKKEDIEYDD